MTDTQTIQTQNRKIKLRNYIAYGAGDLFGGGAFFIATTYMLYYLINVVGLNPVLAGWVPLVGKLWDAINDPLIGYLADKTPANRFGRRRVWFLISILPIALSFILLWLPINIASQGWKFFYYVIVYIFFYTVTTVSYIPYASLSAEMTLDSAERNKLSGFRIFFSFLATLLAGVAIEPILAAFGGSQTGYFVMGVIFALIFAVPWIFLYLGTWELPQFQKSKGNDARFLSNFFSLFKNRSCRIHILMYVCAFGTMDILMALMKFYFNDYLDVRKYFVVLQGVLLITMIAVLPIYIKLATKKGHAIAYRTGLSIVLVGLLLTVFLRPSLNLACYIGVVFIIGFGLAAGSLIPHQLMPFVVDVDRLIFAKERPGAYSSAMTLTRKLLLAFVILRGISSMLGAFGYQQALPSLFKQEHFEDIVAVATSAVEEGKIEANELSLITDNYLFNEESLQYALTVSGESETAYQIRVLFNKLGVKYSGLKTVALSQKEATKIGIKWIYLFAPLVMVIIGLIASLFFKLTPKNHKIILAEIERLENGGKKEDVDAEVKKVCELVTGIKYEKLYVK